jgi:hypothetical protein
VWIQVGIGVWLLAASRGALSRLAGLLSVGWGLVVWAFGESFGGIFAPGLTWLFAPANQPLARPTTRPLLLAAWAIRQSGPPGDLGPVGNDPVIWNEVALNVRSELLEVIAMNLIESSNPFTRNRVFDVTSGSHPADQVVDEIEGLLLCARVAGSPVSAQTRIGR